MNWVLGSIRSLILNFIDMLLWIIFGSYTVVFAVVIFAMFFAGILFLYIVELSNNLVRHRKGWNIWR
jgi:hypothetical protein